MQKTRSGFAWAAVAVLAGSACGSVSSKPDAGGMEAPPGDFTLSVDMSAVTSLITGTANVVVSVARGEGLVDPIVLTASDVPTGVMATFEASSLTTGTDTTGLAFVIDRSASAGTTDITITGTAGSITHTATVSLGLTTMTVAGHVIGNASGVQVGLVGKPSVLSDGNGAFTFTDVKIPYDLYAVGAYGQDTAPYPALRYYQGLTRADPVVWPPRPVCSTCITDLGTSTTGITGTRSGSGMDAGPTYVAFTTATGQEVNTDGSWDFTARWRASNPIGTSTKTGRLQGLQAIRGNVSQPPTGWYFAESADVTLSTANSSSTINLTLAPLATTADLVGTIARPAGYPVPMVTLSQQVAGKTFAVWSTLTTDAACTIPLIAGQKASLHAKAQTPDFEITEGVVPALDAAADVSMTLPAPAVLTAPAMLASNVTTSTPFTFTTTPDQVYEVSMVSDGMPNNQVAYFVVTTSGTLTIPDVPEVLVPAGKNFSWRVLGYGPQASVDEAADTNTLLGVTVEQMETSGTFHTLTQSTITSFTTMQ